MDGKEKYNTCSKSITHVVKAVNVKILHEILIHKLSLYLYTLYHSHKK